VIEDAMNRIVRKHYPVERLPADLRSELSGAVRVRLELEPETAIEGRSVSNLVGTGQRIHGSADEAINHIRDLREDR
jgi:hypothetical protein